jgi:hypothetical protein
MATNETVIARSMRRYIEEGALAEIHRDGVCRETLVARILQCSQHVFYAQKFDEMYLDDGVMIARLDDVTRIKTGSKELESSAPYAAASQHPSLPDVALLEVSAGMTFLQRHFGYVSLYMERLDPEMCFIGEVRELDDDFVLLRQFGTFRTLDRSELLLRLPDITRAEAGGQYERRLLERFRAGSTEG